MERKTRAARLSGVFLLIVAGVLIAANILAYRVNKRFDLTENERFTLSQGSARLVSQGLEDNLLIKFYVTRGLAKQELFIEDVSNLLGEYEQASNGKLNYQVLQAKTDEQKEDAKKAGLREAAFGEGSETADKATIARGFMGIVFEYGSETVAIPIMHPEQTQGLEFWITNKIREVRDKADDKPNKVGVIIKDGIKLTDKTLEASGRYTIQTIMTNNFPFYKFEDVDLKDGEAAINKDLRGVIVLQADKDWNDKELARIDEFLMHGDKSLLVIAGAVNMKPSDAKMKVEISTRNLDKLLSGYGIEMKKESVLDWGSSMRIPVQTQTGGLSWLIAPGVLQLQHDSSAEETEQILDTAFAGFFRQPEVAFPFPSVLAMHPEKQPGAKMKAVARSTERTTVDAAATQDNSLAAQRRPQGEFGQRVIAIELEGQLTSAFAKDKRPEGVKDYPDKTTNGSRVLVISSAQFLCNPFSRAGNPPPMPPQMAMMGRMGGDQNLQALSMPYAQKYLTTTILVFKNLLDWMVNDTDLLAASAKFGSDPNLTYSNVDKPQVDLSKHSEEDVAKMQEDYRLERVNLQRKVQWSLTAVPPLFFALFGFIRWRRREDGRDTISFN